MVGRRLALLSGDLSEHAPLLERLRAAGADAGPRPEFRAQLRARLLADCGGGGGPGRPGQRQRRRNYRRLTVAAVAYAAAAVLTPTRRLAGREPTRR